MTEFTITLAQFPAQTQQDEKMATNWSAPITRTRTTRLYAGRRRRCTCCIPRALLIPPRPTTAPPPPPSSQPIRIRTRRTTIRSAPSPPIPAPSTAQIAQSHITATLRRIPARAPDITLLVLVLALHPAAGCRFVNTLITWSFRSCDGAGGGLRVLELAPQGTKIGLEKGKEKGTEAMGAVRTGSSIREGAPQCVWTVEENTSSRSGVPARLQLATALAHTGTEEVVLGLDVRGELACVCGSASVHVGGTVEQIVDVDAVAADTNERVE
ncbi:hypothetical protein BD779DRAFT_1526361 [Infundibulicybe gibba]|nr:hypothetical protein BD779DRAFT_1526361 [Infundibulicybe gibba]